MKKLNPTGSGVETFRQKVRALMPDSMTAADRIFGVPGQKYPDASAPNYAVEGVVQQLIQNQNELIDKVAALEARPSTPFPGAS